MLVARTNPDAPKHKGISYFIIDMDQPGIEVRPLRQMNGQASFNEVFFTDAVVAHENLVGDVNEGWMVAVATLAYERQGIGGRGGGGAMMGVGGPGEKNGQLDRQISELQAEGRERRGEQAAMFALRTSGAMKDLAQQFDRDADPVTRQAIAGMFAHTEAQRFSGLRARAAAQQGKRPGPEVSTAKLAGSESGRRARDIGLGVLGAHGMLMGDDAPDNGAIAQMALSVQSGSIAGGTDEIQRNIIGERVLGLPKEPQVDRDLPFNELKVGTQRT
jgi:alkylation response protein AidB-like acyl-CoA dehydrogenase